MKVRQKEMKAEVEEIDSNWKLLSQDSLTGEINRV